MKRTINAGIIYLARISGAIRLILFLFRRRVVILMLHGVMDADTKSQWHPTWNRTSCRELDQTLKRLSKHCHFVSMDEAVSMLSGKQALKSNSVVLTFDDGYSNNLTHALPILEKYKVDFIIYIATRYVRERVAFWVDDIDFALSCLVGREKIEVDLGQETYTFYLRDRSTYQSSYAKFRKYLKAMSFKDDYEMLATIESVAQQLGKQSGKSLRDILEQDPWTRPMTMEDLRRVNAATHIGAHTENHIRVTKVDSNALQKELMEPKVELESLTQRPCHHFCYPSGDFDDSAAQRVAQAGYLSAVTSVIGTNTVGDNPYFLKRFSFPQIRKPSDADFWLAKGLLMEKFTRA